MAFLIALRRLWIDMGMNMPPMRRAVRLYSARCRSRERGSPPGLTIDADKAEDRLGRAYRIGDEFIKNQELKLLCGKERAKA